MSFSACFRGSNEAGYETEQIAPIAGRTVTLMLWPEDKAWATAVRLGLTSGLKSLTALIDHPMAGTAPLVIKESVTGNEYAGFYDSDTNTIVVGEDLFQPSLVEHELAHVWFNGTAFEDRWINEGSAEWAGRSASGQSACRRPAPSGSAISLETWAFLTPRSTDAERLALDEQYDAACYVVSQVADAAGPTGMSDALGVLLDGRDPYAVDPNAMRSSKIAG